MSNVLKVSHQEAIRSLSENGWSQRRIARELGLHRRTVGRYIVAAPKCTTISTPGSEEEDPSKCTTISTSGEWGRKSRCEPLAGSILPKVDAGLSAQRIY